MITRDFKELGPSVLRLPEVKLNGWLAYRDHPNPMLREKDREFRKSASASLALLPVAILGPRISLRNRWRYCGQFLRTFRYANWVGRSNVLAAPLLGLLAGVAWIKITLGIQLHPMTRTHVHQGRQAESTPAKRVGVIRTAAATARNGHAKISSKELLPTHTQEA